MIVQGDTRDSVCADQRERRSRSACVPHKQVVVVDGDERVQRRGAPRGTRELHRADGRGERAVVETAGLCGACRLGAELFSVIEALDDLRVLENGVVCERDCRQVGDAVRVARGEKLEVLSRRRDRPQEPERLHVRQRDRRQVHERVFRQLEDLEVFCQHVGGNRNGLVVL